MSEKQNLYGKIIAKALKDDDFKKRLEKNPEDTIKKDFGLEIPAGIKIKVIEDSDTLKHILIPKSVQGEISELTDAEIETVSAAGAPHTGQPTLMCDTAWQTCWICNP
jgi:hypothetical protein